MYQLFNGDCLEIMPTLPAQSVDAIITDLPYGTTACAWDSVIPFEEMWECVKHVLKPNGAFVTTATQPFTSLLVCSNLAWFRHEWIWNKNTPTGFLNVKTSPMKQHEAVLVFTCGGFTYNPQMEKKTYPGFRSGERHNNSLKPVGIYGEGLKNKGDRSDYRFPKTILAFNSCSCWNSGEHPTQKPVDLYKYLVKTYTNPGDMVLDMCFGSNTTGVACIETGRNYIGIEKELKYFELGQKRIAQAQPPLFVETGTPANNGLHATPGSAAQNSLFN